MSLTSDTNAAVGYPHFLTNLCVDIPTRSHESRCNVLRADVAFTEFSLIDVCQQSTASSLAIQSNRDDSNETHAAWPIQFLWFLLGKRTCWFDLDEAQLVQWGDAIKQRRCLCDTSRPSLRQNGDRWGFSDIADDTRWLRDCAAGARPPVDD